MTLWQEWHEEYRRSLKPRELEELADLLFCRPPAFVIAKALKRTPVTPDAVSLFAVLWSLVVSACYWQGHYVASLLGATAYFAWNILDCVDGQLARMRGGGSPIGHIIDEVADVLSTIALWVGIAHHLTVQRPGEHNWWLLSVVTGLVMAIECSVLEGKRHEWMARVLGIRKSVRADLEHVTRVAAGWRAERTHLFGRFVIGFYVGMRWLQHVYLPPSADPVYGTADNTRWAKYHRKALRMSSWLGPTTQMCILLACTAVNRVDAYLWIVLFVGIPWMMLVYVVTWIARHQEQHEQVEGT